MEDLQVTSSVYDFKPARAAMQRYIDGNLLGESALAAETI